MDVCKGRKSLLFCEVFFDIFSGSFAHYGGYFFQCCFFYACHTLKRFQKGGFALLADSRNTVQGRGYLTLASFVAMESDGKSVHFVLYIL